MQTDLTGRHQSNSGRVITTPQESPVPKRIVTQQEAAKALSITDRTVRAWIAQGKIVGYRLPGGRAIRVDLDEINRKMIKIIPAVQAKAQVRAARPPFGEKATIVDVSDADGSPDPIRSVTR
jgi:excisionase family DNA binding protein